MWCAVLGSAHASVNQSPNENHTAELRDDFPTGHEGALQVAVNRWSTKIDDGQYLEYAPLCSMYSTEFSMQVR